MGQRAQLLERYKSLMAKIEAAESAQSASVASGGGSKSYTRGNLQLLYKERDRVVAAINSLDRGGRPAITRVRVETSGGY